MAVRHHRLSRRFFLATVAGAFRAFANGTRGQKGQMFEAEAERELSATVQQAAGKVQSNKRAGKYQEALEVIAGLRMAVDRFFEEVMVMAENEAVRRNRLALLSELLREFTTIADFSEIGSDDGA